MLSDDLLVILPAFVKNTRGSSIGPSTREIRELAQRSGLPVPDDASGKEHLVRLIIDDALGSNPAAGEQFVERFLRLVRGLGGFDEGEDNYVGAEIVTRLRAALGRQGWDLMSDGTVLPRQLDNLTPDEMGEVLWAYVERARRGALDPEIVVGTSKCLEEAVARHVLLAVTGSYAENRSNVVTTLFQAFDRLGLAVPATQDKLDDDPRREVEMAIWLLAVAVTRLRNDRGDGHGRPEPATATPLDAELCSVAASLVSLLLLRTLSTHARRRSQRWGPPADRLALRPLPARPINRAIAVRTSLATAAERSSR